MKFIFYILFITSFFYSSILIAKTIAVVDIQYLIDNNIIYIEKLKEIELSQEKFRKKFQNQENNLNKISNDIEESKLLLNEDEINIQIEDYNKKLHSFAILIEEFNFHYQNQVITIRERVLQEIILLLQEYAIKNNLDLILDSTSYLIASNSIDITENINSELNKINFKLEHKDFEQN